MADEGAQTEQRSQGRLWKVFHKPLWRKKTEAKYIESIRKQLSRSAWWIAMYLILACVIAFIAIRVHLLLYGGLSDIVA